MTIKTVQQARQNGFQVRVNHYRYNTSHFNTLRRICGVFPNQDSQSYYIDKFAQRLGFAPVSKSELESDHISPRGGRTEVEIIKDGKRAVGQSDCSFVDNYNNRQGVMMALGRALENFNKNIVV